MYTVYLRLIGKLVVDFLFVSNVHGKWPFCVFEPPFWGGSGATYNVHIRLICKNVVDFLLVLIKLFAWCYG